MALLSDAAANQIAGGVDLPGAPRLKGSIEKAHLAYQAPIDWPQANAYRRGLQLKSKAEIEAAIHANPSLAKLVDLSGDVPRLKDIELHVTLTGGVNEALAKKPATRDAHKDAAEKTRANDERHVDETKEKQPNKRDAAFEAKVDEIVSQMGADFKTHPLRQKYEAEVAALTSEAEQLIASAQGDRQKLRESAKHMWQKRREISTRYKDVTPAVLREYIYWKNERRTGHDKLGPKWEHLEKKKSYPEIIRGAATPNPDINAFLGGFREWLLTDGAELVK